MGIYIYARYIICFDIVGYPKGVFSTPCLQFPISDHQATSHLDKQECTHIYVTHASCPSKETLDIMGRNFVRKPVHSHMMHPYKFKLGN